MAEATAARDMPQPATLQPDGSFTHESIATIDDRQTRFLVPGDFDGDGKIEIYVAADDQRELMRYTWNADKNAFDKLLLGRLKDNTITWNIEVGEL